MPSAVSASSATVASWIQRSHCCCWVFAFVVGSVMVRERVTTSPFLYTHGEMDAFGSAFLLEEKDSGSRSAPLFVFTDLAICQSLGSLSTKRSQRMLAPGT